MKKPLILFSTVLFLTACQSVSVPRSSEAMGWTLELAEEDLYAAVTVTPRAYAAEQGFESGDLILLENYKPGIRIIDGVEQPVEASDYFKALMIEVCGAGVAGASAKSLDFEVQRGNDLIQIRAENIPRMECA